MTESKVAEDSAGTNAGNGRTEKQETSEAATSQSSSTDNHSQPRSGTTPPSPNDESHATCEFYTATFRSESDLMSHAIQCNNRPADTRFTCQLCGNEYISKRALTQHLEDCDEADGVRINSTPRSSGNNSPSSIAGHTCDN